MEADFKVQRYTKCFHNSITCKYFIFDIKNTFFLFLMNLQQMPYLQYLSWSPQGDSYAYVYRCNIYYKPSVKSSKVYPITIDGTDIMAGGPIYNGIPDWVYEGAF